MTTPYCTDEDILEVAGSDLGLITPIDWSIAFGEDGSIASGAWSLQSVVDFEAQGVTEGRLCHLEASSPPARDAWGAGERTMVVSSSDVTTLVLRNLAKDDEEGHPPGSPTADLDEVRFRVLDFTRKILSASRRIDAAIGVPAAGDDLELDRRRRTCVLLILEELYFQAWRQTDRDVFKSKYLDIKDELKTLRKAEELEVAESAAEGSATGLIRRPCKPNPVYAAFGLTRRRGWPW